MGTIFERVTYYDLYGYTIPGCLLLALCFWKNFLHWFQKLMELPEGVYLYGFLIFIFSGMVVGIIMAELSERFYGMIYGYSCKLHLTEPSLGISYKVIKRALLEAGVAENTTVITNQRDVYNWLWYIYGCIQVDKSYNRIHNYASSQLMYGNLSAAVLAGGIVTIIRVSAWLEIKLLMFLVIAGIAVVLGVRSEKFRVKKEVYAIFWFIEKYLGTKNAEKKKTRDC